MIGEHPVGAGVGFGGHHLLDQPGERLDAGGRLAPAGDPPAVDVPRGQVGQCPTPVVLVLDPHGTGPSRRQGGVAAAAGLDRGFLIRADHELVGAQRFAVPEPGVQVERTGGLDREVGVPREDPRAVLPGFERILGQPAADRGHRRRDLAPLGQLTGQFRGAPPRQRHLRFGRQRARQRDDLGPIRRGEHRWAATARSVPQAGQSLDGEPATPFADRVLAQAQLPLSRRWSHRRPPRARSGPAAGRGIRCAPTGPEQARLFPRPRTGQSHTGWTSTCDRCAALPSRTRGTTRRQRHARPGESPPWSPTQARRKRP